MRKKIKKENIKVREPLKKATRENENIGERLDEITGGFLDTPFMEMKDVKLNIGDVTGISHKSLRGDINVKVSGSNNTAQNTGSIHF